MTTPVKTHCRWLPALLCAIIWVPACAEDLRSSANAAGAAGDGKAELRSKMAGRWSASRADMMTILVNIPHTGRDLPPEWDEHVLVTIREDGRFDWSRMACGMLLYISDLHEPGDRSKAAQPAPDGHEYEVVAAEYTPTRSYIEVRGVPKEDEDYSPLPSVSFDARLQSKGTVELKTVLAWGRPGASEGAFGGPRDKQATTTLRKYRGGNDDKKPIRNESKIAGSWCAVVTEPWSKKQGEETVILVIRPNGTIDWSGCADGLAGGFYQLERVGDRVVSIFPMQTSHELADCEYTPTKSRVRYKIYGAPGVPPSVWECTLSRNEHDKVDVTVSLQGHAKSDYTGTVTLHRCDSPSKRANEVLSTLRTLVGGDKPMPYGERLGYLPPPE